MAPHLSHDEFFSSLTTLLANTSQKSRGSVYLTQKSLSPSLDSKNDSSDLSIQQNSVLIRATDGRTGSLNPKSDKNISKNKEKPPKVKISTIVAPNELEAFYIRYADVCKAGMVGLKKRDRSAKKKGKAKGKGQNKVTKP